MFKKSWPFIFSNVLYKMGQNFLDMQYSVIFKESSNWAFAKTKKNESAFRPRAAEMP